MLAIIILLVIAFIATSVSFTAVSFMMIDTKKQLNTGVSLSLLLSTIGILLFLLIIL